MNKLKKTAIGIGITLGLGGGTVGNPYIFVAGTTIGPDDANVTAVLMGYTIDDDWTY